MMVSSDIENFADALKLGVNICGLEATRASFVERHPESIGTYVAKGNSQAVLVGMDEGECEVGILTEDEWLAAKWPRRH